MLGVFFYSDEFLVSPDGARAQLDYLYYKFAMKRLQT